MTVTFDFLRAPRVPALPGPAVAPADVALAALVFVVEALLACLLPAEAGSDRLDAVGWALLVGSALVLVWRRQSPTLCMVGMLVFVAPYHYLENIQVAPIPSSMVALYAIAVAGPPVRTFLLLPTVIALMAVIMSTISKPHAGTDMLKSAGWIVAVAVAGEVVRMHRNYVAAIVGRAERAERTREEEAARRVAEERLRIARDLHDLLAHSITLIGVQTSVAAHILVADPDRLDRTAVAAALDTIADTCREARVELRTTLRVLRADGDGPLPDLAGIPALAKAAEASGALVELAQPTDGAGDGTVGGPVPPAVGAAAFRIVQESLTNAVRHAGVPAPRITVRVDRRNTALHLLIEDNGSGGSYTGRTPAPDTGGAPPDTGTGRPEGFGILGMRERARSVGGTLSAGPRPDRSGFAVTAVLPFAAEHRQDRNGDRKADQKTDQKADQKTDHRPAHGPDHRTGRGAEHQGDHR